MGKEDEGAGRGEGVPKVKGLLPGRLAYGRGEFRREGEGEEGKVMFERGYKMAELENGNLRGYRIDEQGLVSVVSVAQVKGWPVSRYGEGYVFTGEVRELKGWPDEVMIMINEGFGIGGNKAEGGGNKGQ